MATQAITPNKFYHGTYSFTWTGLEDGDDGDPISPNRGAPALSDKTVQFVGTPGAGASAIVQGSNDGTNWFALTSDGSTPIDISTSGGGAAIYENPLYVRPFIAGGDVTTDWTCVISGRGILLRR